MRPKIVILILVVALGLLGIMAVLKGLTGGHAGDAGGQKPAVEASVESPTAATNDQVVQVVQVNPNSSNTAAIAEQLRAAEVEKEVGAIRDLQGEADGTNNRVVITALVDKLSHPEAEVRQAALDVLKQLNDTNAVPGLEKAAENIKDPREKVAVLDAIEYIKMPSVTDNVPPELAINPNLTENSTLFTNRSVHADVQYNPNFIRGNRKNGKSGNQGQQTAPPNAPAGQPQ
jgi:hypothetical protein